MHKFKLMGLLLLLILGTAVATAQDTTASGEITLERTPCFGTCPVYTVTIREDGTVIYNGENHVTVTGEQTSSIQPESAAALFAAFEDAGYFDWDEAYDTQTVTDLPTIITSVTRNGETHQITRYAGDQSAPLALAFLEYMVDELAYTQQWTGATPDLASISNGTDLPVATMQRTACFGDCPVYQTALYADGTVVFVGLQHVQDVGVHIFEVEPASITSIVQRADSLGYFNWQDSYETMAMTDQATVITSIRSEDQYKRIVRYGGDPNAPVGLVWVEDIIALSVANRVE
jgi:hypothetical protein